VGVDQPDLGDHDPDPSPESAAVVLPGVISRIQRWVEATYQFDPALTAAREILTRLKAECTRFTRREWPDEEVLQ
ncbi:MAG TPA: hypothetical protein VLM40_01005, partial [Gemmata sp.]|nr:hypothetical protein [Gemmata sp.]